MTPSYFTLEFGGIILCPYTTDMQRGHTIPSCRDLWITIS